MEFYPDCWQLEYQRMFLVALREFELTRVEFFTDDTTTPILVFVRELLVARSLEGRHDHYYWNLKSMLAGYITYIERAAKRIISIGPITEGMDKKDFIKYIIETKNIHMKKHEKFNAALEEITNDEFREVQDEFKRKFNFFLTKLNDVKEQVDKFERMDIFQCFVNKHFNNSLSYMNELMEFTSFHISRILYKSVNDIRASLQKNLNIHEGNLKEMIGEQLDAISLLRLQLYEKRKAWVLCSRNDFPETHEISELDNSIKIAEKMLQTHQNITSSRIEKLKRSTFYFETSLKSLDKIVSTIQWAENTCQTIRDLKEKTWKLYKDQRLRTLDCHCQHGPLAEAVKNSAIRSIDEKWEEFIKEYEKQLNGFNTKKEEAFKSLITWLSVKGNTRVMYSDNIGEFYLDEYGRKIYNKNDGKDLFCLKCDGKLEKINQPNRCWFDINAGFTEVSGRTLYERAEGSSRYRLNEQNTMERTVGYCGHTDPKVCARLLKDADDVVRLPDINQVTMERTLNLEDVNYLWEGLGPYLPKALYAVAKLQPNNPIHYLAHRLIFDKYSATEEQAKLDQESAVKYHTKIIAKRLEEKLQIEKNWKDIQMKSPAPKDIEDNQNILHCCSIMQQCLFNAIND